MAENSLRRLRRAAGFSSARAFAEHVGIPAPTYAKYEQIEDGPDTPMPIKNAWAIADALGCSIDELVGRDETGEDPYERIIQGRFDALSDDGRELVSQFMRLAEERDRAAERRRAAELAARYAPKMHELLADYLKAIGAGSGQVDLLTGDYPNFRDIFKGFVEGEAAKGSDSEAQGQIESLREFYESEEHGPEDGFIGSPHFLDLMEKSLTSRAQDKAREEVEGVMAAYDSAFGRSDGDAGDVRYAVVALT